MLFENLSVSRLIVHEVHRRNEDKQKIPPTFGTQLIPLPVEARSAFHDRIIAALGSQSQCMELTIAKAGQDSSFNIAQSLVGVADSDFIPISQRFAEKLADAQTSRQVPGGIVVVFEGNVGHPSSRMVGVIKAEPHTGFMRQITNGTMVLQFLKDLILTPQTKLYKLGLLVEADAGAANIGPPPNGWRAFVYDSQMVSANREAAAQYFYELFLGCTIPQNSALQTKKFYDLTREFVRALEVPEEQKNDLLTGLYTYLKVDTSPSVEVGGFANSYLPSPAMRDAYQNYMGQKDFPLTAIPKNISDLKNILRQRRLTFGGDIKLIAPPERFQNSIQVEQINQDGSVTTTGAWTRVTIRDRISGIE